MESRKNIMASLRGGDVYASDADRNSELLGAVVHNQGLILGVLLDLREQNEAKLK